MPGNTATAPSTAASRRRSIVRACKSKGWTIQPGALATLERIMTSRGETTTTTPTFVVDFMEQWIEPHMIITKNHTTTTVTDQVLDKVIQEYSSNNGNGSRIVVRLSCMEEDEENKNEEDDDEMMIQPVEPRLQDSSSFVVRNASRMTPSTTTTATATTGVRSGGGGGAMTTTTTTTTWAGEPLYVISAFRHPKLVYHTMRQQFRVIEQDESDDDKEWSLFGTPQDKVNMLAQRYALMHQRILRHEKFRPTSLTLFHNSTTTTANDNSNNAAVQFQLTPLERLLGLKWQSSTTTAAAASMGGKSILVLGLLRQINDEGDDRYYLEDPTGLVPISLQHTTEPLATPNLVLAQDHIYLVEGTWHDGILRVIRMGPPLLESRFDSLKAMQQQMQHEFYRFPLSSSSSSSSRSLAAHRGEDHPVVLVSDVHLDQPLAVQQLEGLLASYEVQQQQQRHDNTVTTPLFVFMGNLSSKPIARRSSIQSLLQDELVNTILPKYPHLSANAHFVLIPGPNDIVPAAQAVLPWSLPNLVPTAKKSSSSRIRNLYISTNPTRIHWNGTELVLYRSLPQQHSDYACAAAARRQGLIEVAAATKKNDNDDNDDDDDYDTNLTLGWIQTVLDQAHLAPDLPIYWNYDHAMRLYPLPTCLVVGGAGLVTDVYGGCRIIAPGSLGQAGQYAVYNHNNNSQLPKNKDTSENDDDDDDDDDEDMQDGNDDDDDDDDDDAKMGGAVQLLQLERPLSEESN